MKTNKPQKQAKKFNRDVKHENVESINETFRNSDLISQRTSLQNNKSKPNFSIMTYIKNIIKSIFFKNNTNKNTTNNQATNNSEYFLNSQNSSLNKSGSIPSLQGNATEFAQDNNIKASSTFSTFGKDAKDSSYDIAEGNRRNSLPPPPPPARASSLNKSSSMPSLQDSAIKLAQDNNIKASSAFSTFGKDVKDYSHDMAEGNRRHSSPPLPPVRASSLNKSSSISSLQGNATKSAQDNNIIKGNRRHSSPPSPPPTRISSLNKIKGKNSR